MTRHPHSHSHLHPPTHSHDLSDQQHKVLAALVHAGRPLSAYDVLALLKNDGVKSPPIVYRALDKLVAAGRVHRLESLNAYIACSHGDHAACTHGHHHSSVFAICTGCGKVQEIDDTSRVPATFLKTVTRRVAEITGLCTACHASPSTPLPDKAI
jgi:Fur family zinc uptake transcriptional regulator